eukprot:CAMPEP_0194495780 /NCGR_PEP_ID=MMETSP0253-20130528/13267_1 /TAXON_ID=2966 /ORGANISM="Noctiluca scintillans" /LENGTH=186 /DNA_ID=CAMNT_0039337093 /DNA_START=89 /DNA_END=646 /DNA_ORIENTATION=-
MQECEWGYESVGRTPQDEGTEYALHLHDGDVLFDMLDKDHDGFLSRREARIWFRSLGWCLCDEALDEFLNEVADHPRERQGWELSSLLSVATKHLAVCGPDPRAIRSALHTLMGPRRSFDRDTFRREASRFDLGFTAQDIDHLLDLCAIRPHAPEVLVEAVVDGIVQAICLPKAPQHRSALQGSLW